MIVAPNIATDKGQLVRKIFTPEALMQLVNGMSAAIADSFRHHPMRESKESEVRGRFKICMDWALVLRGDLKWGVQRIIDAFPPMLKTELGGGKWKPPERQCWIPGDGG